ncbi:glycosyltransferase [Nonomuraea sp. NPDC001699]
MVDEGRRPLLIVSNAGVGVFNPLRVLAAELARRGTENLWFASDEPRRADVEKIDGGGGIRFASLGEINPYYSPVDWDEATYRQMTQRSRWKAHRAVVRRGFGALGTREKSAAIEAVVDELDPALMIFDSVNLPALVVALKRKIPFVLSSPFMPSNLLMPRGFPMLHTGLPYRMSFAQRIRNRVFRLRAGLMLLHPSMLRHVLDTVSRVRKGLLPPEALNVRAKVENADLVLCYTVAGLEYPLSIPEKFHLVGAMIPPLPEAPDDRDLSRWLDDHPSVVYVGLGTITRLTRDDVHAMVEVARRLDGEHAVLWKLPDEQQRHLPPADRLPANLRIESWLPSQLDVLAHPSVRLFVNHGGGNAFHEGLYFGKPQVIRPLWVDCYDQAVRGVDSGVSLTVDDPQIIDADDVFGKITHVLGTPSFRERAEHFSSELRAAGGAPTAADLVLSHPALK